MDPKTRSPAYLKFLENCADLKTPSQQTTFDLFASLQKVDLNELSEAELEKLFGKFKIWKMFK